MFRRILLVLSVAAITAAMMVFSAVPAFAQTVFPPEACEEGDLVNGSLEKLECKVGDASFEIKDFGENVECKVGDAKFESKEGEQGPCAIGIPDPDPE